MTWDLSRERERLLRGLSEAIAYVWGTSVDAPTLNFSEVGCGGGKGSLRSMIRKSGTTLELADDLDLSAVPLPSISGFRFVQFHPMAHHP